MTDTVTVYAVFADAAEAQRIGRQMVEERLAACINILQPCRSIYLWSGEIQSADECPALFKTRRDASERLVARIGELHSFDTPAIAVWPIEHLPDLYERWVADTVRI